MFLEKKTRFKKFQEIKEIMQLKIELIFYFFFHDVLFLVFPRYLHFIIYLTAINKNKSSFCKF